MTLPTDKRLKAGLKLAVTLVLLAFSLHFIRPGQLVQSLHGARLGPLAVSALLLLMGTFAGAASWFFILRMRLGHIRFREVLATHWAGMFFNTFLPTNVGGDVVKSCVMARGKNATGFIVTSVILDRLLNLGLLLLIGLLALLCTTGHRAAAGILSAAAIAAAAGTVAVSRYVWRRLRQAGHTGKGARVLRPVCELAATPKTLFPALFAAALSQSLKIWQNAFVIHALGLSLPTLYVWFIIPLFGIVSALPVSIGGLGVREVVAQFIAGPLNLDNTDLVSLSLAGHVMVILLNMFGLVPCLLLKRKHATHCPDAVTRGSHP